MPKIEIPYEIKRKDEHKSALDRVDPKRAAVVAGVLTASALLYSNRREIGSFISEKTGRAKKKAEEVIEHANGARRGVQRKIEDSDISQQLENTPEDSSTEAILSQAD